ncbi:hypothetical protein ACFC0S_16400 [Streptomyces sp. NPDC056084]|uniref:hypothetical protein n=1 Tax=unclassified Streptomyces TaxID=2593676 RepID=UPI0035DA683C
MALYMLKEVDPATGRLFQDDDTTVYYHDHDYASDADALAAAIRGYDLRVAQDDANWGPGAGKQRWTLLKVG